MKTPARTRAMNLESILFTQGFGSRRECRALIAGARVAVVEAGHTDANSAAGNGSSNDNNGASSPGNSSGSNDASNRGNGSVNNDNNTDVGNGSSDPNPGSNSRDGNNANSGGNSNNDDAPGDSASPRLCTDPLAAFDTTALVFTVDGAPWRFRERAYLALNKPAGYECSRDPQHHLSVFHLLPAPLVARGVQCVGRLDQDTTGLLLLSDDGQFIHALTSPRRKVPKVYRARTRHPLDDAQLHALRAGVRLHGETQPVVAVSALARGAHELELSLLEGKYHQVKRMVAAVGNRVDALHRERIGALALPAALAPGHWQWLDAAQLDALRPSRASG